MGESQLLRADGFDNCIMGLGRQANHFSIVYDEDKIINTLCDRDKMSFEDAREYYEFNIASAYVGAGTPTFVRIMGFESITELTQE
tara:strand:- start:2473 stop:2730 length:258 start_codon:yes stop_codon:yes gene_type:complete